MSEGGELASSGVWAAFEAGHAHQAADGDVLVVGGGGEERFELVGGEAVFGGVVRDVDFEQDGDRSEFFFVDGGQESRGVDGMEEGDQRERAAELVSLEVADEVPLDGQVGELGGLFPELLRSAFAQVVAAGGDEWSDDVGRDVFGDGDEFDGVGGSAASRGGVGNLLANASDVVGDSSGRVVHSTASTAVTFWAFERRMQAGCL